MSDLTLTVIENLIIDKIGAEAASEGLFLTDRKVWVSDVSLISMTCPYCAQTFVGPDYNVYHLLATHEYGHRHEEEMIRKAAQDDDEGGLSV
jgi:hypothetical protein